MAVILPGNMAIVVTSSGNLNLRRTPSTAQTPIGSLPPNSAVRVDGPLEGAACPGESTCFYPVTTPAGQSGYAAESHLIPAPAAVVAVAPVIPPAEAIPTVSIELPQDVPQVTPTLAAPSAGPSKALLIGGAALVVGILVVAAASSPAKGGTSKARTAKTARR